MLDSNTFRSVAVSMSVTVSMLMSAVTMPVTMLVAMSVALFTVSMVTLAGTSAALLALPITRCLPARACRSRGSLRTALLAPAADQIRKLARNSRSRSDVLVVCEPQLGPRLARLADDFHLWRSRRRLDPLGRGRRVGADRQLHGGFCGSCSALARPALDTEVDRLDDETLAFQAETEVVLACAAAAAPDA